MAVNAGLFDLFYDPEILIIEGLGVPCHLSLAIRILQFLVGMIYWSLVAMQKDAF